jgi:flagellum-specific peptidoglycan hydrolase FlgJ
MKVNNNALPQDVQTADSLNKLYAGAHLKMKADQARIQASIKKDIESFVQTLHQEASPASLSQFSHCVLQ